MERIVIVGAGLAAHRAAGALRGDGHTGAIVVVGDEADALYDRPPLSKAVLAGTAEEDRCTLRPDLEGVELRTGTAAVGLDPAGRVLTLADGTELTYDGLLIATGRRARTLPMFDGLDGVHTLRSLADCRRLAAAVRDAPAVAIVGAGFIGCEVAATLRGLGVADVDVIDVATQPMPVIGAELGARAQALHEEQGVRFHLGSGVREVTSEDGAVTGLVLGDDTSVPAQVVLVAAGSVPNTEWLEGSGLELERGAVACDEHCLVRGQEGIAAAGDVAAWPNPMAGEGLAIVEHWSNAKDMGALAARNLLRGAAEREAHLAVPSFWSDQYDVKIKSVGFLGSADRFEVVDEIPAKRAVVAEAFRGDVLIGAIAFNRNRTIIDYGKRLAAGAHA